MLINGVSNIKKTKFVQRHLVVWVECHEQIPASVNSWWECTKSSKSIKRACGAEVELVKGQIAKGGRESKRVR